MFSRPVIVPLILLIVGIILVDGLIPPFVIGEHYCSHLSEAEAYRYRIKQENKTTKNWKSYNAEVEQWFDGMNWHDTLKVFILKPSHTV